MKLFINQLPCIRKNEETFLITEDICYKTIAGNRVPIPFTNVAFASDATKTTETVFYQTLPLCHQESYITNSKGDEPGDQKGVRSGTLQGKAVFINASANVFFEGKAAVRHGDKMISNQNNTEPAAILYNGD